MGSALSDSNFTDSMDKRFFELEIKRWKASPERAEQIDGQRYYAFQHDILKRERLAIGRGGKLERVGNLPNNRIVDNQFTKLVTQKTNYLVGKPLTFDTDDAAFESCLREIFDQKWHMRICRVMSDALQCGIGWLYVFYDEEGDFCMRRFDPVECLPFWKDEEHTKLDAFVRVYTAEGYEGDLPYTAEKVEIYREGGVGYFELTENGELIEDVARDYVVYKGKIGMNWGRIPIVGFKYNDQEIPLIRFVKTLQDALNASVSDFQNAMGEDPRNTILVLKNYDGQNLGEFRHNLALYGAVKVKTIDGSGGAVETLKIDVDSANYKAAEQSLKRAIIENGMGYDAKDDRMGGSPNQMNIQSMYSDIDLDANGTERQWQASLADLLWFVKAHLLNCGRGNFIKSELSIIFNRDMMFSESEVMDTLYKGGLQLSNRTLIGQVPFVDDVERELERIKEEGAQSIDEYENAFPKPGVLAGEVRKPGASDGGEVT
jgi:SPP1 family phage portal protein